MDIHARQAVPGAVVVLQRAGQADHPLVMRVWPPYDGIEEIQDDQQKEDGHHRGGQGDEHGRHVELGAAGMWVEIQVDRRFLPGESCDGILKDLHRRLADVPGGVEIRLVKEGRAFHTDAQAALPRRLGAGALLFGVSLLYATTATTDLAAMGRYLWEHPGPQAAMLYLGVVLTFVALGVALLSLRAIGEPLGWGFQLQSPGVITALALLFVLTSSSPKGKDLTYTAFRTQVSKGNVAEVTYDNVSAKITGKFVKGDDGKQAEFHTTGLVPFPDADRLVAVWHSAPGINLEMLPQGPATYLTYREEGRTFEEIGLWQNGMVTVTGLSEPERVPALMVTDGTLLKVYAWYDNEMGYACRMVDLACHMETVGI